MRILIILALLAATQQYVTAQTRQVLESRIDFCRSENERLENENEKYKGLLELQAAELQQMKHRVVGIQEDLEEANEEKKKLQNVAVDLLNLGKALENEKDKQPAIRVYKIIYRSYPNSKEARIARERIKTLRKD